MDRPLRNPDIHNSACTCCADLLDRQFNRRRFLHVAVGSFTAAAVAPWYAFAGNDDTTYEAMVLSCIDPRLQDLVCEYTAGRNLTDKYSQFTIAGASIGVVAPRFKDWHETFWDNLRITLALHKIAKVIVINHRDCGAATEAYGPFEPDSEAETRLHKAVLAEFREQLARRHPQLEVETGLMDLEGNFEVMP